MILVQIITKFILCKATEDKLIEEELTEDVCKRISGGFDLEKQYLKNNFSKFINEIGLYEITKDFKQKFHYLNGTYELVPKGDKTMFKMSCEIPLSFAQDHKKTNGVYYQLVNILSSAKYRYIILGSYFEMSKDGDIKLIDNSLEIHLQALIHEFIVYPYILNKQCFYECLNRVINILESNNDIDADINKNGFKLSLFIKAESAKPFYQIIFDLCKFHIDKESVDDFQQLIKIITELLKKNTTEQVNIKRLLTLFKDLMNIYYFIVQVEGFQWVNFLYFELEESFIKTVIKKEFIFDGEVPQNITKKTLSILVRDSEQVETQFSYLDYDICVDENYVKLFFDYSKYLKFKGCEFELSLYSTKDR